MNSFKLIMQKIRDNKKLFILTAVFMVIGSLISKAIPTVIKIISDTDMNLTVHKIAGICMFLVAAGFVSYFSNYFADKYYFIMGDKIGNMMTEYFVKKILASKKKDLVEINSDKLLRIVTNDLTKLKTSMLNYYFLIISVVISSASILIFVVLLDYKLAIITVIWYTVFYFLSRKIIDQVVGAVKNERNAYGKVLSFVKSSLFGIFDLKYYSKQEFFFRKLQEVNEEYLRADVDYMLKMSLSRYLGFISDFFCVAIILFYKFIFEKETSTGTLLAMYMYSMDFSNIFSKITMIRSRRKDIQTLCKPMDDFLNIIDSRKRDIVPSEKISAVEFDDITLNYNGKCVFRNFSRMLEAGNIYVIDGESGTGKSSLVNILLDEINYEGNVKINGTDIDRINSSYMYSRIGAILQDVYLISGSIKENILLYDECADEEKLLNIIRFLNLGDGSRGIGSSEVETISGGEKKRIALARLLLKLEEKDILIFDETFANIDFRMSQKILDEFMKVRDDKILIFITHDQNIKDYLLKQDSKFIELERYK